MHTPEHAAPTSVPASAPKKHRVRKIILTIVGVLVGLVLLIIIGLNAYVHIAYNTFYSTARDDFAIPEQNSGFITQDLTYLDGVEAWLFSGYMADHSDSPLIMRTQDGTVKTYYVTNPDGSAYTGHGGGVTANDDYIYLTTEEGYLVIPLNNLLFAEEGAHIQATEKVDLDFSPAFINIENGQLYTGEFYYPNDYETPESHRLTTPNGDENPSIMCSFAADPQNEGRFLTEPDAVFSITGMVQGTCITDEGNIVLSTSYGLATSHMLEYSVELSSPQDTFTMNDGTQVGLYYLDSSNLVGDLEAPPMLEGIESHEGRVYTCTEAASNKYIFGKFYGAGVVYSIPFSDL
jgi:hypothetical protein